MDIGYKGYYWGNLTGALSLIYLGVFGYKFNAWNLQNDAMEAGVDKIKAQEKPQESNYDVTTKKRLDDYMAQEEPYLDPDLTLSKLAESSKIAIGELSSLINKAYGKNFNDYINEYRVEKVKQDIQSGGTEQYTILAIAYSAGFNSKSTFNRSFKKFTGTSPTQYISQNKG